MDRTLANHPLVELIREISSKDMSGALRLEHDRAQTAVYFDKGQLVYAASNLRTLRLREYLSKQSLLSTTDLASLDNSNLSDLALAEALSASGKLEEQQIDSVLTTLVGDVLRVALLWTEGTWEFSERARLDNPIRTQIDVASLLREVAQRMPLNFVSQRFRNPSEFFTRTSGVSETTRFLPNESFLLSRLDKPTRLEELVSLSGLREQDAHRVIYGLAVGGFLKREYWQNAFRETAKPKVEKPVVPVATGTPANLVVESESRWVSVSDKDADLDEFLERLKKATNHYEILELPSTASTNEIKEAYYALARRYHPDRFHLKSGTRLHGEISSAFARVTQAYETLTDPNTRANYDQSVERSRRFAEAARKEAAKQVAASDDPDSEMNESAAELGRAEYSFQEGFGALQQGRINAAVAHLSAASRLAPHEARYRAYHGRALAASEQTRRLAENEIQAAIKLEPGNALFRIMLAELYFDLKFHRRAQTELDRALALEPENATARSLLRKLQKSRKVG